ncbi:MAG: class I SAM-dependent methyltransferase [Terriglobia bacterium]
MITWLALPRRPEPEVMEEAGGVEAYVSAAAQAYLDAVDNTFVDRAVTLGVREGVVLDAGTGPGSIPLKLARRLPRLRVVGADLSPAMLHEAVKKARERGLGDRASFVLANASALCFGDGVFDLVISNSLLHHLSDPVAAFNEWARVSKPGGKILLRDLRRPSRLTFAAHVAWHGRHYSGRMKQLYEDSVRAAYTPDELRNLARASRLSAARIFLRRQTHIGLVWEK